MKKLYSAPIADLIETEMDNVMAGASLEIIYDDPDPDNPDLPGFGEAKPGGGSGIFDYDE